MPQRWTQCVRFPHGPAPTPGALAPNVTILGVGVDAAGSGRHSLAIARRPDRRATGEAESKVTGRLFPC